MDPARASELLPAEKLPTEHLDLNDYEERDVSSLQKLFGATLRRYKARWSITHNGYLKDKEPAYQFIQYGTALQAVEGAEWKFTRFLGAGANGRVAKWVEIDVNSGNIIDEIAVKEIDNAWIEAAKTDPNLPREVVVNRDLNTYDVAYIAYLRGYKYFPATDKARLYQQVYNLGSLETLISLYKIYGYYLPEWFVCRALLDLCESLRILDKPPPQDTKYNAWTGFGGKKPKYEDLRTIHLDWKPENTFLGEPGSDPIDYEHDQEAPVVVIADFGNARYTSEADPSNPAGLIYFGTPGYYAPENLAGIWRYYDTLIDGDVEAATEDDKGAVASHDGKKFLPYENNVYGIGRIILDLMLPIPKTDPAKIFRMNDGWDTEDEYGYLNPFSTYYVPHKPLPTTAAGMRVHLDNILSPTACDNFPYSDGLVKLVSQMLSPDPTHRLYYGRLQGEAEGLLEDAENLDEQRSHLAWSIHRSSPPRLLFRPDDWWAAHQSRQFTVEKEEGEEPTSVFEQWEKDVWDRALTLLYGWDPDLPLPPRPQWFEEKHYDGWGYMSWTRPDFTELLGYGDDDEILERKNQGINTGAQLPNTGTGEDEDDDEEEDEEEDQAGQDNEEDDDEEDEYTDEEDEPEEFANYEQAEEADSEEEQPQPQQPSPGPAQSSGWTHLNDKSPKRPARRPPPENEDSEEEEPPRKKRKGKEVASEPQKAKTPSPEPEEQPVAESPAKKPAQRPAPDDEEYEDEQPAKKKRKGKEVAPEPEEEEPPVRRPAGKQPAGKMPAGKQPAGKMPAGKMPAGERPAGKQPAGKKPAGKRPAGKKPAAKSEEEEEKPTAEPSRRSRRQRGHSPEVKGLK